MVAAHRASVVLGSLEGARMTWYVAIAKPAQEALALCNLVAQDYEAWLPLCSVERRHARRKTITNAPLFPRYLFVRVRSRQPWGPIMSTRGVQGLVTMGSGLPVEVPPGMIGLLRRRIDADGGTFRIDSGAAVMQLVAGQRLMVSEGPFADIAGFFVSDERDRVKMLLSIVGRPVPVAIPREHVTAMETAEAAMERMQRKDAR